jgi:hypothetical protein
MEPLCSCTVSNGWVGDLLGTKRHTRDGVQFSDRPLACVRPWFTLQQHTHTKTLKNLFSTFWVVQLRCIHLRGWHNKVSQNGWVSQQKFILAQLWRREVWEECVDRVEFLQGWTGKDVFQDVATRQHLFPVPSHLLPSVNTRFHNSSYKDTRHTQRELRLVVNSFNKKLLQEYTQWHKTYNCQHTWKR